MLVASKWWCHTAPSRAQTGSTNKMVFCLPHHLVFVPLYAFVKHSWHSRRATITPLRVSGMICSGCPILIPVKDLFVPRSDHLVAAGSFSTRGRLDFTISWSHRSCISRCLSDLLAMPCTAVEPVSNANCVPLNPMDLRICCDINPAAPPRHSVVLGFSMREPQRSVQRMSSPTGALRSGSAQLERSLVVGLNGLPVTVTVYWQLCRLLLKNELPNFSWVLWQIPDQPFQSNLMESCWD